MLFWEKIAERTKYTGDDKLASEATAIVVAIRKFAGSKVYKNQLAHDPSDLNRAREIASMTDVIPVGILYHNPEVPCYEDLRNAGSLRSPDLIRSGLEAEFDKFTIWPQAAERGKRAAA